MSAFGLSRFALFFGAWGVLSGCDVEKLAQRRSGLDQADPAPLSPSPLPQATPVPVRPPPSLTPSVAVPPPGGAVVAPAGAPLSFADLAAQANPAVVFVRTIHTTRYGYRQVMNEGSGSGFIFDAAGLILTNYHVVSRAQAIQVDLFDDQKLPAQIVGADPLTDIAVLRVQGGALPTLPLGDSDQVRVGDWVLAIGNPFGLAHTVSAGILSARERTREDVELGDPRAYYSFLQTDASINPGNSGGPLLDLRGQVVGINTAINPEANSIGFAIPINMVRELLPRLLSDGVIERAAIGIHVADERTGARIVRTVPGGPAERAGLRAGDLVVEVGGHSIVDATSLRWWVSLARVGAPVDVVVLRDRARVTIPVIPALLDTR